MSNAADRARGILLGLAAGDRNGGPIRMAVRLAESLAQRSAFDAADIGARYLDWWHNGAFDTGPTASRVFQLVDSGLSLDDAPRQAHEESGGHTAGCNPAHRSAPLAMASALDTKRLASYAEMEAKLTHYHALSADAAAAVVLTCRELVRGASWQEAIESARSGRLPETRRALSDRSRGSLKSGGFAPDVLAAAIHFVQSSATFEEALNAALQFAGPANYCPVIVGSIGGARWGADAISQMMLDDCDILTRVRSVAQELASGWA